MATKFGRIFQCKIAFRWGKKTDLASGKYEPPAREGQSVQCVVGYLTKPFVVFDDSNLNGYFSYLLNHGCLLEFAPASVQIIFCA